MQFILRPFKPEDVQSLVAYANNMAIAKNMANQFPHPYTAEHANTFIDIATKGNPPHILAIDIDGKASGGIGIHVQGDIYCKNAELGYWLAQPFWGHGIMPQAVKQMVDYGFKHWDVNRIFARPFGSNTASQKVLEKAGFVLEARFNNTIYKNGHYEDELVYAVRRS